ncbi:MAG: hypothetical protein OET41_06900 [Xanthomonadales bacterium]|nr:hypothetical protein [Xanthomonadales bacterium]
MQNVRRYILVVFVSFCTAFVLSGCSMQAKIIQSRHWDLNETIRQTNDQQLLLNMVRMRYEETPYFLQISSITTSFSAGANAGLQASLPSGGDGPDVYTPSAGFSYSETPTVTWSIPDSSEMLARFYSPIGTDQLTVLAQSGFDFIEVFSVGTRKINALTNRTFSMKDGLLVPPEYDEFREALRLMKELTREGLADTTYSLNAKYGGVTLPITQMEPRGVAEGLAIGQLYLSREPGQATPLQAIKPLHLRFTQQSDDDPRAKRLRELLKLRPDLYTYPIMDVTDVSPEGLRSLDGKLAQVFDPDEKMAHIMLTNRSVIEILQFAAAYITAPETDIEKGLVRNRDLGANDLLTVLSSPTEPDDAWLKIKYRDVWFYVPSTDLNSRSTFGLLSALFSSVVGDVPGAKPILTLPLN